MAHFTNWAERYQIDVRQIAIQYEASALSATLSGLSVLRARIAVEPKTLQTAAAATQEWNEYLKGLAVGYNSCAITKQQYDEGLKRLVPGLKADGAEELVSWPVGRPHVPALRKVMDSPFFRPQVALRLPPLGHHRYVPSGGAEPS